VRIAAVKGSAAMKRRTFTLQERAWKRKLAKRLNLIGYAREGRMNFWTPEEMTLLETMPDTDVAKQTGRTVNAVRLRRGELGLPNPSDRRRLHR
jgi:hypothetical protein